MGIIDSFRENSEPIIQIEDVYPKSDIKFDAFILTFSRRVIEALMEDGLIELIAEDAIRSISCNYPIYRFKGTNIGIIKSTIGAPVASVLMHEMGHIYSCNKAVMFGTCGALDSSIPKNKIIIPTAAYRDEGTSYHYAAPSDYIEIKNADKVASVLDRLGVDYVMGKSWTTDAFYRETREEMEERRAEGCIAVEMELSAMQAVCDYAGIELYSFLYRADNLDSATWEKGQRDSLLSKNERLEILNIAFEIARRSKDF